MVPDELGEALHVAPALCCALLPVATPRMRCIRLRTRARDAPEFPSRPLLRQVERCRLGKIRHFFLKRESSRPVQIQRTRWQCTAPPTKPAAKKTAQRLRALQMRTGTIKLSACALKVDRWRRGGSMHARQNWSSAKRFRKRSAGSQPRPVLKSAQVHPSHPLIVLC